MQWLRETRDVFQSYDNLELLPRMGKPVLSKKSHSGLWLGLFALFSLSTLLWAFALPGLPAVTDLHINISYHPNAVIPSPSKQLDIYSRKAPWSWQKISRPVVLFVHDGSPSEGDKQHAYFRVREYVRRGYVFVAINYRTNPTLGSMIQASDVARAVAWVSRHIHKYRGDGQRISLVGAGVGAKLIAMVKNDPRFLKEHHLSTTILQSNPQ